MAHVSTGLPTKIIIFKIFILYLFLLCNLKQRVQLILINKEKIVFFNDRNKVPNPYTLVLEHFSTCLAYGIKILGAHF